ncbi:MAG: hypothetical protein AAF576_01810, partial [Pseudomonadota bacterium]
MPTPPSLNRNIRKGLEEIIFPHIETPQAQAAALNAFLALAGPRVQARLLRIAALIKPDFTPTPKVLRAMIALIIASHVGQYAADWDDHSFSDILRDIAEYVGPNDALLAALARAFADRGIPGDEKIQADFLKKAGISFLTEPDTEDLGADLGDDLPEAFITPEDPVIIVSTPNGPDTAADPTDTAAPTDTDPNTSNEAEPMPDTTVSVLLDEFTECYAFDTAKLPPNLQYEAKNGSEALSPGQRNFIQGVEDALALQGLGGKPGMRHAVMGLLLADGTYDPDERGFYDAVRAAVSELKSAASPTGKNEVPGNDVFEKDFKLRADVFAAVEGVLKANRPIFVDALSKVGRAMVEIYDSRPPGSAGFASATRAKYNDVTLSGAGGGGGGSGIAFLDLPPLSGGDVESDQIVPANIRAVSAIYVVYQCEQMMLFPVVDRIVELFMAGLLPMAGDNLARKLDEYYWDNDDRVSPNGRAAQFTRALNAGGGNVG